MMQLLLAAALVAPASAATNKTRPVLLTSFAANSWSHNYASGSFNQTVVGPVVVDAGRLSVSQESPLADGRSTRVVLDYAAGAAGGVWSLQPFFGERVCYIYPLPAAGPPVVGGGGGAALAAVRHAVRAAPPAAVFKAMRWG